MATMLQTVSVESGAEKATAVNEAMRTHMLSLLRDFNEQRSLAERLCAKGDYSNAHYRQNCMEVLKTQIVEASHVAALLSDWRYGAIYSDGVHRYTALLIWRNRNEPAPDEPWDCDKLETEYMRVEV